MGKVLIQPIETIDFSGSTYELNDNNTQNKQLNKFNINRKKKGKIQQRKFKLESNKYYFH